VDPEDAAFRKIITYGSPLETEAVEPRNQYGVEFLLPVRAPPVLFHCLAKTSVCCVVERQFGKHCL
jgi:hypothetical protein